METISTLLGLFLFSYIITCIMHVIFEEQFNKFLNDIEDIDFKIKEYINDSSLPNANILKQINENNEKKEELKEKYTRKALLYNTIFLSILFIFLDKYGIF